MLNRTVSVPKEYIGKKMIYHLNNLWFLGENVFSVFSSIDNHRIYHYPAPNPLSTMILIPSTNSIWVADTAGFVHVFGCSKGIQVKKTLSFNISPSSFVTSFALSPVNLSLVWATLSDGSLVRLHSHNNSIHSSFAIASSGLTSICSHKPNLLWIGDSNGSIYCVHENRLTLAHPNSTLTTNLRTLRSHTGVLGNESTMPIYIEGDEDGIDIIEHKQNKNEAGAVTTLLGNDKHAIIGFENGTVRVVSLLDDSSKTKQNEARFILREVITIDFLSKIESFIEWDEWILISVSDSFYLVPKAKILSDKSADLVDTAGVNAPTTTGSPLHRSSPQLHQQKGSPQNLTKSTKSFSSKQPSTRTLQLTKLDLDWSNYTPLSGCVQDSTTLWVAMQSGMCIRFIPENERTPQLMRRRSEEAKTQTVKAKVLDKRTSLLVTSHTSTTPIVARTTLPSSHSPSGISVSSPQIISPTRTDRSTTQTDANTSPSFVLSTNTSAVDTPHTFRDPLKPETENRPSPSNLKHYSTIPNINQTPSHVSSSPPLIVLSSTSAQLLTEAGGVLGELAEKGRIDRDQAILRIEQQKRECVERREDLFDESGGKEEREMGEREQLVEAHHTLATVILQNEYLTMVAETVKRTLSEVGRERGELEEREERRKEGERKEEEENRRKNEEEKRRMEEEAEKAKSEREQHEKELRALREECAALKSQITDEQRRADEEKERRAEAEQKLAQTAAELVEEKKKAGETLHLASQRKSEKEDERKEREHIAVLQKELGEERQRRAEDTDKLALLITDNAVLQKKKERLEKDLEALKTEIAKEREHHRSELERKDEELDRLNKTVTTLSTPSNLKTPIRRPAQSPTPRNARSSSVSSLSSLVSTSFEEELLQGQQEMMGIIANQTLALEISMVRLFEKVETVKDLRGQMATLSYSFADMILKEELQLARDVKSREKRNRRCCLILPTLAYFRSMIINLLFHVVFCANLNGPINITILHTTDIHGWIYGHRHDKSMDADLADLHSAISIMKKKQSDSNLVFAFDTGDLMDGTGLSELTTPKGKSIFYAMKSMPYDAMSIGNHELQNPTSMNYMMESFIPAMNGRYLAGQSVHKSPPKSMGAPYRLIPLPNNQGNLLAIGFVINMQTAHREVTQQTVEAFLNDARLNPVWANPTIKAVVCLCHFGSSDALVTTVKNKLRAHFPTQPVVFLCGHTHTEISSKIDDNTIKQESAFYFHCLGVINFQLYLNGNTANVDENGQSSFQALRTLSSSAFSGPNAVSFNQKYVSMSRKNLMSLAGCSDISVWNSREALLLRNSINSNVAHLGLNAQIGCSPQTYLFIPKIPIISIYPLLLDKVLQKYGPTVSRNERVFSMHLLRIRDNLNKGPIFVDDLYTIDMYDFPIYVFPNLTHTHLAALLAIDASPSPTNIDPLAVLSNEDDLDHASGLLSSSPASNAYRQSNFAFKDKYNVGSVTPKAGKFYDFFADSNIAGVVQAKLNQIAPGVYTLKPTGTTFRPVLKEYIEKEMKC
ncbi:putative phosphoprotein phosphatase [Blattamonas nauphoetae]|uniref:Phosphoprotein phosphatase n=1 Tax=Blattamonas nauphoetae TaxID=2049346 RepID=A0ABQ9XNG2_9EUKA|nr:putative phosphoprotein phosphatase [Blattamonas nauphoetae]